MALKISVIAAQAHEAFQIDEDGDIPEGATPFDTSDWQCSFFGNLSYGDWIVEIDDPDRVLNNNHVVGRFLVHCDDDSSGCFKRLG